ncbi:Mitogen-activated protein kinase mpkC [Clarias magur]|uniref:Mitogen-activated protein kinase mpkC n=1 Tax=Clarias magur TaxID=1594786 RepID=A0A8J4U3P2_CLAMG|nr:Mitogen-activated protein kinase mpkC [Clarias magur]
MQTTNKSTPRIAVHRYAAAGSLQNLPDETLRLAVGFETLQLKRGIMTFNASDWLRVFPDSLDQNRSRRNHE